MAISLRTTYRPFQLLVRLNIQRADLSIAEGWCRLPAVVEGSGLAITHRGARRGAMNGYK